jgi:hypothetical protein
MSRRLSASGELDDVADLIDRAASSGDSLKKRRKRIELLYRPVIKWHSCSRRADTATDVAELGVGPPSMSLWRLPSHSPD